MTHHESHEHASKKGGCDPMQCLVKSASNNPWFTLAIGLIGIIIGYSFGINMGSGADAPTPPAQVAQAPARPTPTPTPTPAPPPSNETPPTVDDDDVMGDKNAPVTLIEFTDYQCPFCARHVTQTSGQIKNDYIDTGKVKYVTRDFPLRFHQHAQKASEASECAGDQGKFWEMHDVLFTKQSDWSKSPDAVGVFKQYAGDLGLDQGDFDDCLDSGKNAAEVQKDMADGSASGVSGTPGFWIIGPDGKGQRLSGALPYQSFKSAIDSYLN